MTSVALLPTGTPARICRSIFCGSTRGTPWIRIALKDATMPSVIQTTLLLVFNGQSPYRHAHDRTPFVGGMADHESELRPGRTCGRFGAAAFSRVFSQEARQLEVQTALCL